MRRLVRKQKDNGTWPYRGARHTYLRSADNYDQLETYRMVGELVEKFGMTRDHSAMRQAAEYLFSYQTNEGDFRGIYGTQYSPNYSAAIMELLIKAGYARFCGTRATPSLVGGDEGRHAARLAILST